MIRCFRPLQNLFKNIPRGRRPACFFTLAIVVLIVGVAVSQPQATAVLPTHWVTSWGTEIGSILAALILAHAVVDSTHSRRLEKLEAERRERLTAKLEQELRARTRELEHANQRLQALAITDELTGAFNRRYFNELCDKVLTRQLRDEPLAFCRFDIDHFRPFNELLGHQAGDQALQAIAVTIQGEFKRASDLLFRLGGEEFGVLFTANSPESAREFADHLRGVIREHKIYHPASEAGIVTASFGLVWCSPLSPITREEIYNCTGKLLCQAKDNGRDRVEVFEL